MISTAQVEQLVDYHLNFPHEFRAQKAWMKKIGLIWLFKNCFQLTKSEFKGITKTY